LASKSDKLTSFNLSDILVIKLVALSKVLIKLCNCFSEPTLTIGFFANLFIYASAFLNAAYSDFLIDAPGSSCWIACYNCFNVLW